MTLELSKADAQEAISDDHEDYRLVLTEDQGSGRWSSHHYAVITPRNSTSGPWYGVNYSRGLTEYQDEQPFEYDGDTIHFQEVVPVQKVVTTFEPKIRFDTVENKKK